MSIIYKLNPTPFEYYNGLQINIMATQKAVFHFATEADDEPRTTVIKVKTIHLVDQEEVFLFPKDKQTKDKHTQLFGLEIVKDVVKGLKVRGKFRNIKVTLTDELLSIYQDEEGHVTFHDEYLDEAPPRSPRPHDALAGRPTRVLAKEIVLDIFNGKNHNASTWMKSFVLECSRVGIEQTKYAETLRIFLSDSALDWFNVYINQHTLAEEWNSWKNSFIDTFESQSWDEVEYAYQYKFLNGFLLDFALKKRSLLLEVDPELTINSQINLIVIALPKFIQSRLDKNLLKKVEDLMASLKQIGPVKAKVDKVEKNRVISVKNMDSPGAAVQIEKRKFRSQVQRHQIGE